MLSNELYRICAPTIIVIPPYVMHKTEGGPFIKYNVNVSEKFFVSGAAILYNFKKYTNCSPIDFLLSVRLNNAKKLLTEGGIIT